MGCQPIVMDGDGTYHATETELVSGSTVESSSYDVGASGGIGSGGGAFGAVYSPSYPTPPRYPSPTTDSSTLPRWTSEEPSGPSSLGWTKLVHSIFDTVGRWLRFLSPGGSRVGDTPVWDDETQSWINLHFPLWKENWTKMEVLGVLIMTAFTLLISILLTIMVVAPIDCHSLPRNRKECIQLAIPSVTLAESQFLICIVFVLLFICSYHQRKDRLKTLMTQRVIVLSSIFLVCYSIITLVLVHATVSPVYMIVHIVLLIWIWNLTT